MNFIKKYFYTIGISCNLVTYGMAVSYILSQKETDYSALLFFSSLVLIHVIAWIHQLKLHVSENLERYKNEIQN